MTKFTFIGLITTQIHALDIKANYVLAQTQVQVAGDRVYAPVER